MLNRIYWRIQDRIELDAAARRAYRKAHTACLREGVRVMTFLTGCLTRWTRCAALSVTG
jgi:hypothetical protein